MYNITPFLFFRRRYDLSYFNALYQKILLKWPMLDFGIIIPLLGTNPFYHSNTVGKKTAWNTNKAVLKAVTHIQVT